MQDLTLSVLTFLSTGSKLFSDECRNKIRFKMIQAKNLALIFWNFLVVSTNLKSCLYLPFVSKYNLKHSKPSVGCRYFLTLHQCLLTNSELLYTAKLEQRGIWACGISQQVNK